MKKPTLCCSFTWIVFIELNFTVAFLLIRKTWDDQFVGKIGGLGILRNGGILVMGDDFEMGGLIPNYGIYIKYWLNLTKLRKLSEPIFYQYLN